ncbi:MAG: hypothetical protein CMI18_11105 [Opitutaceae bacterium]|nr:hypothetical protein [Opitutaceae bacterium]|tara:strand:- start:3090 stop:3521 length:432 start_codon:yes stop_codon:yes gene_type:complete
MFDSVNKDPNPKDLRKFAYTLLIGLPIVGLIWAGILLWTGSLHWVVFYVFAIIGIAVCVLTLLIPPAGRIAYIIWHCLAAIIEAVTSFISTFLMYVLTILPIGLIMKLIGRKPLPAMKFKQGRESYWSDHETNSDLKRYFRQY